MVTFYAIPEVIGVGHVHLRLHITLVCRFHVPLEGFLRALLHTFAVKLALAYVETAIDIAQLRSLHIPLKRQFKAVLYAMATLIADSKVIHRLGVALIGLLAIAVCLVPFLGYYFSCFPSENALPTVFPSWI